MKNISLIALALAAGTALAAADSTATPPTAPTKSPAPARAATAKPAAKPAKPMSAAAKAEAATIEKFVALQDAAITCFKELGVTLEGVTDETSADAAAPAVRVLSEQLCSVIARAEALGEPSVAVKQAIMARMADKTEQEELANQVMMPLLDLMMQEPPCYGSDALHDELMAMLVNLQGAAGMEEDDDAEGTEGSAPLQEPDADEAADNADATEE